MIKGQIRIKSSRVDGLTGLPVLGYWAIILVIDPLYA